ncbi:hypothetical protein GLOIN_2v1778046 [Rhizophagus clarus]|uniref:Uncharacterized protein n=1 Tax=Rhizophagus clarus TaxID=94130 RepID=A0A8H3QRV3_9GLOM|nr:hypothetical protein GLOIN_2v1778046 [Rhizophagus clarus]
MAIIIELANAIDGFVDNPTTAREILADQIKRLIRSIRCKYNEAICDNEIIRRQNAEGVEQMVIADLHQLRANAQNQVKGMITSMDELKAEKLLLQRMY